MTVRGLRIVEIESDGRRATHLHGYCMLCLHCLCEHEIVVMSTERKGPNHHVYEEREHLSRLHASLICPGSTDDLLVKVNVNVI